jgi:hypothetical protein
LGKRKKKAGIASKGFRALLRVLFFLLALSGPLHAEQGIIENLPLGQIDWTQGEIHVKGIGSRPEGVSSIQGQQLARRTAIADAFQKLLGLTDKIRISNQKALGGESARSRLEAAVKGASIGEPSFLSDGSALVELSLPLFGRRSLALALPPSLIRKASQEGLPPSRGSCTGLIVDARGLGCQPSMNPSILDPGGIELYGGAIGPGDEGINYFSSLEAAGPRVGPNPLVLRAIRASGPLKTDLVLGEEEAKRLSVEEKRASFRKSVCVLIDL